MKIRFAVVCGLLLSISTSSLKAQDLDRIIQGWGWLSLDRAVGPVTEYTYTPATGQVNTEAMQLHGYGVLAGMYAFRYNFSEPDSEKAFSLSVQPALSVGFYSNAGRFYFNLPVMAGWDFGAGSTYNSNANVGGFLRLGFEYNVLPLLKDMSDVEISREYATYENGQYEIRRVRAKTSFLNPCIGGGFRYWSRNNVMKEIGLKVG